MAVAAIFTRAIDNQISKILQCRDRYKALIICNHHLPASWRQLDSLKPHPKQSSKHSAILETGYRTVELLTDCLGCGLNVSDCL